jgi:integrase
MAGGLHIVSKRKVGRPLRWYVYAYRGGPLIHKAEGPRPRITAAIQDLAAEARKARGVIAGQVPTIATLIDAFATDTTPEWKRLAKSTKQDYRMWLERIRLEFGDAPLAVFDDRKIRGDILGWRDRWADRPRSADGAIEVMSRLLSWGEDRGRLKMNAAKGIERLYEVDRSEVIWEKADFDQFIAAAPIEVREGVELAAATGLRRGDLVKLPWAAVGDHAIVWRTSKSRGKTVVTIPLLSEAKAVLARIRERHEATMAARPVGKRISLPETVLSNTRWQPWTAMGFGSRFNDAKIASGVDKHLHDLRGTFVTRCCIAGLTDQEIADIVGWDTADIASIRRRYTDNSRVVIAIAERIARAEGL